MRFKHFIKKRLLSLPWVKISEGGSDVDGEVVPLQAVLLRSTHDEAVPVLALTLLLLQFDVKRYVFRHQNKSGSEHSEHGIVVSFALKTWKMRPGISTRVWRRASDFRVRLFETACTTFGLASQRDCCRQTELQSQHAMDRSKSTARCGSNTIANNWTLRSCKESEIKREIVELK